MKYVAKYTHDYNCMTMKWSENLHKYYINMTVCMKKKILFLIAKMFYSQTARNDHAQSRPINCDEHHGNLVKIRFILGDIVIYHYITVVTLTLH